MMAKQIPLMIITHANEHVKSRRLEMNTLLFLGLSLMLGFKHSFDADHLVAVSNILIRSRKVWQTIKLSVAWAIGHMATAAIITIILFWSRDLFLSKFLEPFEVGVGAMLIALGVWSSIKEFNVLPRFGHAHHHRHDGDSPHEHIHAHCQPNRDHKIMLGIGVVHGIASNDELLVLIVTGLSVATLGGLLVAIATFSVGVVIGMTAFGLISTWILNRPKGALIKRVMTVVVGLLSVAYGAYMILSLTLIKPR